MKPLALGLCAITVTAATASLEPRSEPVRKCTDVAVRFPDAPEPAYVLNAQLVRPDSVPRLDPARIESITIRCTDYVYETFGIEARRTGVIIFTAPGPHASLIAHMDSIEALQTAYSREHGHFSSSLSALRGSPETGLISVELTVSEDGSSWKATGTHRYLGGDAPVVGGGTRNPTSVR